MPVFFFVHQLWVCNLLSCLKAERAFVSLYICGVPTLAKLRMEAGCVTCRAFVAHSLCFDLISPIGVREALPFFALSTGLSFQSREQQLAKQSDIQRVSRRLGCLSCWPAPRRTYARHLLKSAAVVVVLK